RLMRRLRPTVTLPYTIKPVFYGTIAAWLAGVPHRYALVTGLGYAFTDRRGGLLTVIIRTLYRFALGKAHRVFFQNPDDENLFRETGLLPVSVPSVVVNGSGVDAAAFAVATLPQGHPTFLMIGRLLGDKGVREYAEAARRIKARHPEVRFRLVGWIDTNPDAITQSELDAWVARGTLDFLGKLDDVRPAIADSTVYVLPSYREGIPRTVLEAMAMGRPIITTDAPGCRETVIDGDNGFLVPVKSIDALVEAMLNFIEDPGLAPRMGRRSREIAEEKYDVHKVNAVLLREMGVAPPQDENAHAI
ncbi:MAG: glycosyltransferase family 4 protein, partial [Gammaproteobacteria bacterium]|nr:glycosyltransferase family 4 protein [Gammaproteobacteria bacterium]